MKKTAFVGTKNLGLSVLRAMYQAGPDLLAGVITMDDSQDARCSLSGYREFSEQTGKPLRVLSRNSELQEAITEFRPDLCVLVGWYRLLERELLEMVQGGWLGFHASLLPKYRGGAPLVWSLINGETESGLSIFYLDEGMDTGDIVAQEKFEIESDATIADLLQKVEVLAVDWIRESYIKLLDGTFSRVAQDHSQATYAARRQPGDGRINWNQSSVQLYNFIRAQTHPYPGAFCLTSSNQILRVWKAKVFPHPYYGMPGQIVMIENDHVVVTCGGGTAISLYSVQLENQDEESAVKLLKSEGRLR